MEPRRSPQTALPFLFFGACSAQAPAPPPAPVVEPAPPTPVAESAPPVPPAFEISSAAFAQGSAVPQLHTCQGEDSSPALSWSSVPEGTASLALIVDDPDAPDPAAPQMTWVHWLLYNLPADSQGLPAAVGTTPQSELPTGTLQGLNDWKRTGYGGPCPPIGQHRYFHKLYALDVALPDLQQPDKAQLEVAMEGHVLARCELMGTYAKQ